MAANLVLDEFAWNPTAKDSKTKVDKTVYRVSAQGHIYDHSVSLVDDDPKEEQCQGRFQEDSGNDICSGKCEKVLAILLA